MRFTFPVGKETRSACARGCLGSVPDIVRQRNEWLQPPESQQKRRERAAPLWISCGFAGDRLGINGTQDVVFLIDQMLPVNFFTSILGAFGN